MAPQKKASSKTRKAGTTKKAAPKKAAVKRAFPKTSAQSKRSGGQAKKTTKKVTRKKPQEKSAAKPVPQKKLKPVKKDTLLKKSEAITFPRVVTLSLLAPLVPSNPDQIAAGVARFGGMFFVLAGAFFAVLNLQFFNQSLDQVYQSANVVTTTCDTIADPNCVTDSTTGTASNVALNPDVTFTINAQQPLTGKVDVLMETGIVTGMKVLVEDIDTGMETVLGPAEKRSESGDRSEWKIVWNTELKPDGVYRLFAKVTNIDQSVYLQESQNEYVVENHTAANVTTTTVTDTTTNTTQNTTATTDKVDLVSLEIVQDDLSDIIRVNIRADNAEYIKLSMINLDTKKYHLLGKASERVAGEWFYNIDTSQFEAGEYELTVQGVGFDGSTDRLIEKIIIEEVTTETATTTGETTTTQEVVANTEQTTESLKEPDIKLYTLRGGTQSGYADLAIETTEAKYIELYATPAFSGMKKFIGLARKADVDLWKYKWNTTNIPNGVYALTAHVQNPYGYYISDTVSVKVFNEPVVTYTEKEQQYVEVLESAASATETVVTPEEKSGVATTDASQQVEGSQEDQTQEVVATPLFQKSAEELDPLLQELAVALRSADEEEIAAIKKEIRLLEADLATRGEDVTKAFENAIDRVENNAKVIERIIKERTGNTASTDSDSDGITDFDEVNIYGTDPFVADSDNDGFTDGVEVLGGYDPKDATPETLVVYESPKETGIVREDLLRVDTITTAPEESEDADGVSERAFISGRGLPNSYVTIYIFSTPVIVTVKTDADGGWSYTFDKELEDGEHEVYIGVTDNAGKIVAKSEPLRFVKQAQAFTPIDVEASAGAVIQTPQNTTFNSQRVILIILSISVVVIGLLLILLGLHVSTRRKDEFLVAEPANANTT